MTNAPVWPSIQILIEKRMRKRIRIVNSDPMVQKSSKSDVWGRISDPREKFKKIEKIDRVEFTAANWRKSLPLLIVATTSRPR